jgi:hypothetical protein
MKNRTVKQVVFLSGVVGLTTKDLARAVLGWMFRTSVTRVIHPIDVLDSRIQNLRLVAREANRC